MPEKPAQPSINKAECHRTAPFGAVLLRLLGISRYFDNSGTVNKFLDASFTFGHTKTEVIRTCHRKALILLLKISVKITM